VTSVRALRARLRAVYGRPVSRFHGRPLDELVLTVLSQSTSDRNRDVAYARLTHALPTWETVRDAPLEAVEAAIRPGGLSRVKSVRIQAMLRALGEPLDLGWLAHAPVEVGRAHLMGLPGVGRKTAACVLLFSFGRRDVPVDTHVGRVGARLGLLPATGTSEALHDAMLALTPRGAELELHVNLLRHGRRTCHAQRPRCAECVLRRRCPSARA
jgi:endonuclease-3